MSPTRWRRCMLAIGVATSACSGVPSVAHRVFTVAQAESALWPRGLQVEYRQPTEEQRRALHELIGTLWSGVAPQPAPELAALASRANMVLELWTIAGRPTWVVREPASSLHGLGIYLVHAVAAPQVRSILLQAPHVYFDRQTQFIAAAMFWAADVPDQLHGLFTNSVHRFQQTSAVRDRRRFNPADVAHNSEHPFQTATAAVLERGPVIVIQLHGFDGEQRDSTATAVVSAGRADASTEESSRVAATLQSIAGAAVVRYPEETQSFGGLGNVQGRLIGTSPSARFVHIELELELRKRLRDPELAARWARALVEEIDAEPLP